MDSEGVWRRISKGKAKAAPKVRPDVAVAVNAKGWVTVNLSAATVAALGWRDGLRLQLEALEAPDLVHLRLAPAKDGDFALRAPPLAPKAKTQSDRLFVALGMCGGIELGSRRSGAIAAYIAEDGVLTLTLARVVDAGDGEADEDDTEQADREVEHEVAKPAAARASLTRAAAPPPPAPRPARDTVNDIDLALAAQFALTAAAKAWPTKIATTETPVRVAAGVALVELGFADGLVRAELDLEHLRLPQREDMRNHSLRAATDALEALREAVEP